MLAQQNPSTQAPSMSLRQVTFSICRTSSRALSGAQHISSRPWYSNRLQKNQGIDVPHTTGERSYGSYRNYGNLSIRYYKALGPVKESAAFLRTPTLSQKRCLKVEAANTDHGVRLEITPDADAVDAETQGAAIGSIHLIVGPMFAGKTTALLKRVEAEASTGRRVALVKSNKDTRYGLAAIVSHDGRRMPCWAVSSLANFRAQIGEEEYSKLDVIGIDEAQFLNDLYSFCQFAADYESKILIVAGLDGDFQRNKFGSILELVPLADSVVKLSSKCEVCGKSAHFTFRKTGDRNKEVIGGTDVYMPVCRQHYFSGKMALKATRAVLSTHQHNYAFLDCEGVEIPTENIVVD